MDRKNGIKDWIRAFPGFGVGKSASAAWARMKKDVRTGTSVCRDAALLTLGILALGAWWLFVIMPLSLICLVGAVVTRVLWARETAEPADKTAADGVAI